MHNGLNFNNHVDQYYKILLVVIMTKSSDNFFEKVYTIARQIPYGKVTSYGAIAKALGTARSARMVGWAMNAAHNLEDVPAHRVVNRKGLLTGKHHFDGTNLMQQLLESEGIIVVDNQIIDLEKHFWEPEIHF
jgi:methylated-DNA-protein-cysteine methyltransferase related protein